jgi:hypothetical protein
MKRLRNVGMTALAVMSLAACQPNANKIAMEVAAPPVSKIELRPLETRHYDTLDEKKLLSAATQTLQDLGFTISESSADVGELSASKHRDAHETGQIVGAVVLAVLFGAGAAVFDTDQTIIVTVVTAPVANSKAIDVRVTFNRLITNNKGGTREEVVEDAPVYQEFFDKLSTGVSLESHKI